MAFTHVLTPIRIANTEIRNRVVRTAHATLLGGGTMSDDLIAYHAARGRGGVGLSIIEPLSPHPSALYGLNIYAPGVEEGYAKLVEQVRPTGMKIFQQITHSGHNVGTADGSPPWSASDLPGFLEGVPAIPMSKGMIDEMVGAFAETARKMAAWGMDGVEIHAAHGYLPIQFLSPILNRRTDDYGGPFENRIRFFHELMTAVRAAVPKDFPVGVRLSTDDNPVMLSVEENIRTIDYLRDHGLIDYVNISFGNTPAMRKAIGGMHEPTGYQMPTSAEIGRNARLPRIVTGRFRTLEDADQLIRDGDSDMVSFVRALIADPDLVNKTAAGHPEQVRPCIGCNQGCVGRVLVLPYRMGCAINAGAGFENRLGDDRLVATETPKKLLVVGGGPAGMEAARVAALRGHKVTLAEASPRLGGAILLAAKAPTRHGMTDFTNWLEQEIYRLGVDVRLSTYVDADDVIGGEWEAVIVATGSTPRMDGVTQSNLAEPTRGMEQRHVVSSHELMSGARPNPGRTAVVIDDGGQYEGLAVAEYLAGQGMKVNFVTRHISVAPRAEGSLMVEPALMRLAKLDFTPHLRMRALEISAEGVTIAPSYLPATTNEKVTLPADTVVFISLNHGNRDIYDELSGKIADLRIVGDAHSARQLPEAVSDGHKAGASI